MDLRNPLNLVPAAVGIVIGVGGVSLKITDDFEPGGIALGTLVVITGYHGLRAFAPPHTKERVREEEPLLDAGTSSYDGTADRQAQAQAQAPPPPPAPAPAPAPAPEANGR
ncbi:hypothetical protein ACFYOP_30540 [Streptomyces sp. NPDC006294]|uniref:hypothetical protein n=1 Tax=Streptomyces sp. NPDC006294 TaxID=3364743 RepID=UPI0036CFA0C5